MKNKKKKKNKTVTASPEESLSEAAEVKSAPEETAKLAEDSVPVTEETEVPVEVDSDAADEDKTDTEKDDSVACSADNATSAENDTEETESESAESESEENSKLKKKREKSPHVKGESSFIKLIVTLSAVCVAIAVLLGGVNLITRAKIAEAAEKEKTEAILSVFKGGDSSKLVKTTDSGDEIHLVYKGKSVIGYCVFTTASGFGGDIEMIVGINPDYTTRGVKIIAMSETPGVGTKTNTLDFLDRFIGKSHSAPIDGVEAISGATISSNAVKSAVAAAHKIDFDLNDAAKAEGAVVLTPADTETDENNTSSVPSTPGSESSSEVSPDTTPSGSVSDSDSIDPTETVDTSEPSEETNDIPFVENGWKQPYYYVVSTGTSFDRYVIEVTKVTDESREIILDPVEVTTETPTAPPTSAPTSAPTMAPVTEPPTSATTGIHSIPLVTTGPESSDSPIGSVTVPSEEVSSEPVSSETTPVDPTPTTPVSPDTDDPAGNTDPVVQPGISIGGRTVGQN